MKKESESTGASAKRIWALLLPIFLLACAGQEKIAPTGLGSQKSGDAICESSEKLKSVIEEIANGDNGALSENISLKCWKVTRGYLEEKIPTYAVISMRDDVWLRKEDGRLKLPEVIIPCVRVKELIDFEEDWIIANTESQIGSGIPILLASIKSKWFKNIQFASIDGCVFSVEISQ